jgi:hypothetical protein
VLIRTSTGYTGTLNNSNFRDKTKFGGQNRLRQKCLHRRCQMDTHRRSSGAAVGGGGGGAAGLTVGSPEPATAIYSGLELARLAAVGQQENNASNSEERHSVFPKLLGRYFVQFQF